MKPLPKKHRAQYELVLSRLETEGCIKGFSIDKDKVVPQWKDGGAQRAFQELSKNPKGAFTLSPPQCTSLLMLLPGELRDKFYKAFVAQLGDKK